MHFSLCSAFIRVSVNLLHFKKNVGFTKYSVLSVMKYLCYNLTDRVVMSWM